MLMQNQIKEYARVGAIVVPDVLSPDEVRRLRQVTDEFVERSRSVTQNDDVYDLEDAHTPALPRVRRIKSPEQRHPDYGAVVRHEKIVAVLAALWGPNIRFDGAKLNMKSAGIGAAVEWHQDWAFYPHTNDSLAAVGVMMDDMELENGPLMILPGSHKGPIFDHHANGRFCGAMDPANEEVDFSKAIALTGGLDNGPPRSRRAWLGSQHIEQGAPAPAASVPRCRCLAAVRLSRGAGGIRQADGSRDIFRSAAHGAPARVPAAAAAGTGRVHL
jgi:hypothetical protein